MKRLRKVTGVLLKAWDVEAAGGLRQAWDRTSGSPLWARRRWLRLFGWPGAAGAGLLAACLALYFSAVAPAQVRLAEAQQSAISIQEKVKRAASGLNHNSLAPAEQLAAFYRIFPKDKDLLPWLEKVFVLAGNEGVRLNQGEYRVVQDKTGKLLRFEMSLPVKSGYPQLRRYLSALHAAVPIVVMQQLQFERQKVGDTEVEARIKLAIYLERAS